MATMVQEPLAAMQKREQGAVKEEAMPDSVAVASSEPNGNGVTPGDSNLEQPEAAQEPASEKEATERSGKEAAASEAQPMEVEKEESKPVADSKPAAAPSVGAKAPANGAGAARVAAPQANGNAAEDSDSEDDVPLAKRVITPAAKPKPGAAQKRALQNGDAKPGAAKKVKKPEPAAAPARKNPPKDKVFTGEARRGTDRAQAAPRRPAKPAAEAGGARAENKEKKWDTLVHAGVLFPPEYERHHVKPLYEGKPVELTTEQEELVTMIAMMKETEYMQKPTFPKSP